MVKIAGKYEVIKSENFVEYLIGLGIPEDKAKQVDAARPTTEVKVDGSKIELKTLAGTSSFVLNQEVDEIVVTGLKVMSTAVLNDDTLTITSKTDDGRGGVRTYKFTDTDLTLTIVSNDSKIPTAKRVYKRL